MRVVLHSQLHMPYLNIGIIDAKGGMAGSGDNSWTPSDVKKLAVKKQKVEGYPL